MNVALLASLLLYFANAGSTDQAIELSDEDLRGLREAPSAVINSPPSERLQAALKKNDITSTEAKAIPGGVLAYVTYAEFAISATRTYRPKVLCTADEEGTWHHCQDESSIIAKLDGFQPVIVSDSIDDQELQSILLFVDSKKLFTFGMKAIRSSDVYHVNIICEGVGIHMKKDEEYPSVYLRKEEGGYEIWGGNQVQGLDVPDFMKKGRRDAT